MGGHLHPGRRVGGRHRARSARRAFTMAEAVLSIFIVGVVLVAALHTVGAARYGEQRTADRARGAHLAQELLNEILRQDYEDPDNGAGSFGVGGDEVGDGTRELWEDVDDYDGWEASPPQRKDGSEMTGFDDWGRRVEVDWVDPDDLDRVVNYDTRVKRIRVTATHLGIPVGTLVAIRTAAWPVRTESGTSGSSNSPPTAVAQSSLDSGLAPLIVSFYAGNSSDPDPDDEDNLIYVWDFGDGDGATGINPTHIFASGTYTVTLTVSDGRGGTATDKLTIEAY